MAKLGEVCKVSASTKMIDKSKAWLLNLDMVEQQTGRVVEYNFVGEDADNNTILNKEYIEFAKEYIANDQAATN